LKCTVVCVRSEIPGAAYSSDRTTLLLVSCLHSVSAGTYFAQLYEWKTKMEMDLKYQVLRIRDVYPGSEFFRPGSRVKKIPDPDPHQRILVFLTQGNDRSPPFPISSDLFSTFIDVSGSGPRSLIKF
jgi:hypothetical protein